MKTFIKNWWNKPWTNGSYVKLCTGAIIASIVVWAGILMKYYGWFESIGKWFRNLFHKKNNYYEQNREAE